MNKFKINDLVEIKKSTYYENDLHQDYIGKIGKVILITPKWIRVLFEDINAQWNYKLDDVAHVSQNRVYQEYRYKELVKEQIKLKDNIQYLTNKIYSYQAELQEEQICYKKNQYRLEKLKAKLKKGE